LPLHPALSGPFPNHFSGSTNSAVLNPVNGLLMVTRLDGPNFDIANGLVDKAMEAEESGLWGRAYFDARGLTNSSYLRGDELIKNAYESARRYGFESILDDNPSTFPPGAPLSHIALYFGWYDSMVSGPFTRPKVEFMPGAIAYHLHSFSAHQLRTVDQYWVG